MLITRRVALFDYSFLSLIQTSISPNTAQDGLAQKYTPAQETQHQLSEHSLQKLGHARLKPHSVAKAAMEIANTTAASRLHRTRKT